MTQKSICYVGEYDFENVDYFLEDETKDSVLYYSYDANLCPLPNMSSWSKDYREEQAEFLRERLKDINKTITVDDYVIKEKI